MHKLRRFLTGNRSWEQTVLKNSFWQVVAEVVVRGLKVGQVFLMVRYLGPSAYGGFALAMAFVTLFGMLFDSGLLLTITREFARDPDNEQLLGDVLLLKCVLGVVGFCSIWLGSYWVAHEAAIRPMILVLGGAIFCGEWVNLSFGVLRARQRMEFECLIRVVQAVIIFGAVLFVLWLSPSALNLCFAYLASAAITLALLAAPLARFRQRLRLAFRWQVWKRLMRIALPLALAGGVSSLYMNIDTVMLGGWNSMKVVGWYDAADRLSSYTTIPMSLVSMVMLPAFAAGSLTVDRAFLRRWDQWTASMVALGVFSGCALIAGGEWMIRLAFGAMFLPARPALEVLALTIFLLYVYSPCFQGLILFDRQGQLFVVLALAVVVNVGLNLVSIPRYGMVGAAWAAVATHLFILCGLYLCAIQSTPVRPVTRALVGSLAGSLLAAVPAFFVMRAGARFDFWITMPLGGMIYALFLLGLVRLDRAIGWRLLGLEYKSSAMLAARAPGAGEIAGERPCRRIAESR